MYVRKIKRKLHTHRNLLKKHTHTVHTHESLINTLYKHLQTDVETVVVNTVHSRALCPDEPVDSFLVCLSATAEKYNKN